MTDRVLLSANTDNVEACVSLAVERGLGIEFMAFAHPHILDGDWKQLVTRYRALLAPVRGIVTLHGPFFDMAPGSIDDKVKFLTMARYEQAVRIAADLGAKIVVLHANFIAAIRTEDYRRTWQSRNIDFWGRLGDFAERHNITLAIENMWEFHPDIIGDVLRTVEHARVRACLDVGHAHLYSEVSFDTWLSRLGPYVVHLHINNNPGDLDFHQGLHQGVLDYRSLLPRLRALPHTPSMTLEMDMVSDMSASLELLELA